jgi:hypothetical protein
MYPNPFVVKINTYLNFSVEISRLEMWASSVIFKKAAQSKQSSNSRKFAQFGHPVCEPFRNCTCADFFTVGAYI